MSGVMVSLTPLLKASMDRPTQFSEYAEFKDVDDMIQKLNILSGLMAFHRSRFQGKSARVSTFY